MDASSTILTCSVVITSDAEQEDVDAFLVRRIGAIMKIGFQVDMTEQEHAEIVNEYRRALRHHPKWVLAKAMDIAVRSSTHRPTPGNIEAAVNSVRKPIVDEIGRRRREAERENSPYSFTEKTVEEKAQAERDLRAAGFTPKRFDMVRRKRMATTEAELYQHDMQDRVPHWTETVAADDPKMEALRAARAANPIMAEAMRGIDGGAA